MDILMMVALAVVTIVVVSIAAMGIITLDLMNYTATGAETLNPTGEVVGTALVVYSPGLSGAAKNAAVDIAGDLKSRGYNVTLTGVKNEAATKTSGYDIIIVGGPMYFGKASSSIETYLKGVKIPTDAKLGVFTTTGSAEFNNEDMELLEKQVALLQDNLANNTVTKTLRSGDKTHIDSADLINKVIK